MVSPTAARLSDVAAGALKAAKETPLFSAGLASSFSPRTTYEASTGITRSYFLGHHHAALARMRRALSSVGLIIECRDFRVPLTSWNPLLESSLAGGERARIIVYTKRDLGPPAGRGGGGDPAGATRTLANGAEDLPGSEIVRRLARFHEEQGHADAVVFLGMGEEGGRGGGGGRRSGSGTTDKALLAAVKRVAREADTLMGLRALVVGMPNAGKSTLLNRLRARGMGPGLSKAARTGAQPGVTRKLGTPVRIAAGDDGAGEDGASHGLGEGVFVMDTPGVFVPYVADPESMLKLALVGCVKDGLVPAITVADYLLYHLNLHDPGLYAAYCPPTNDVHDFLRGVARRTGKLVKGGEPSMEAAADWIVQEWRRGALGRFVLDELSPAALAGAVHGAANPPLSMNQARKKEKEMRKARFEAKRTGADAGSGGAQA